MRPFEAVKEEGGAGLAFTLSPIEQAELWKPDFAIAQLGKQVPTTDSTKDHDTSLTLAWEVNC